MTLPGSLIKFLFLGLVVAIAYGFYNPEIIPQDSLKEKVLGIRDQVPHQEGLVTETASWLTQTAQKTYTHIATTVKVPKELTGLPEEVVVEEAVKQLGDKVKTLPVEQAHKVKQYFCADIVAESLSASSSSQTETGL
jgi:hypothetical protein